nr:hypothetical protein BaRGS_004273 [Batillaria attramentaria]
MTEVLQQYLPTILMLSFILSVIIMSKNIVQEKELQLKESMKLMGLSAAAHWTAWFVQFFIYLVVVCIIYTLFMSIANVAAAVGGILFFAIFFPFFFLEPRYEDLTLQDKLGACVLFNMAMAYGIKTIGLYEGTGEGAQWDSFTEPASVDDNFSLLHAMLMLIVDTIIFFILTWYIDNVHPGFLPPTSGTAYVNGYDIRTDINSVRNNLGLCPQHDILFETLTVDEHLTFFARLKGCPKKEVAREVEAMAKEVGLESKRKAYAGTLSGGQKRKLSVGIALIWGSKIVIFDEPTSGMDPAARRQTWDVLQKHRAGRTVLLSTHFMDEADLLGDRIAIMAEGVVKCYGTSMFLKKLYGAGYHLVIVKGPNCDVDAVTAAVRGEISGAELEAEVGAELSYLLPEDQVSKFPKLFEMIETQEKKLAVLSVEDGYQRLTGFDVDLSRFYGMFMKKAIHTFRNRVISAVQLAMPVIFTIIALLVDKVRLTGPQLASEGAVGGARLEDMGWSLWACATWTLVSVGDDEFREINRTKYQDINQYFLNQADDVGLFTYLKKVVMGADFEPGNGTSGLAATAWYSGQPYHAMPTALAYLMNGLARQRSESSTVTGDVDKNITTISHPMPKDQQAAAKDTLAQAQMLGFSIGYSMLFGMAFLTSSFSYFLIRERQCGAKHVQVVSGVGPFAFWLASFAWDMVNYLIPCLALLVVFAAFQVDAYTEDDNMGLVFLLLVVFGMGVIPFTYILQFIFVTPATGFVVIVVISIVSGMFTMLTVVILRIPSVHLSDVAETLDWIFMVVFPHYSVGLGVWCWMLAS